jgi:splicing factor U2AF subunit
VWQKVCDNVGDHLIGNVYARYEWETEAQAAVDSCNERWYAGRCLSSLFSGRKSIHEISGRPLYAELSPVTDFREACCRQNENGECNRGGFCNFMHLRNASPELVKQLRHGQRLERKLHPPQHQGGGGWEPSKRNRSASPPSRRGRDGEDRWSRKRD